MIELTGADVLDVLFETLLVLLIFSGGNVLLLPLLLVLLLNIGEVEFAIDEFIVG